MANDENLPAGTSFISITAINQYKRLVFLNHARASLGRRAPGFLKLLLSTNVCMHVCLLVCVCVCVCVCMCVCVCPPLRL